MDQRAVSVRVAGKGEARALAELHRSVALYAYADIFPGDAPPPELAQMIAEWTAMIGPGRPSQQECFVAHTHDAIVGVVCAGPAPGSPSSGYLSRLYVEQTQWGRGIGRLLHDHALNHLKAHGFANATLWVLESNTRARRWYERLGWRATNARKVTYAPGGIDDVGYERPLIS